ncbi:MAG: hypothetical protein ACHQQQ_08090 [Bacteroidota bacterium]
MLDVMQIAVAAGVLMTDIVYIFEGLLKQGYGSCVFSDKFVQQFNSKTQDNQFISPVIWFITSLQIEVVPKILITT